MLEPRVMQVLVALGETPGRVLSRDDLIALCWDGRIVGDKAITRAISLLRQALDQLGGGAVRIETIAKVGFRVIHEGEPATASPPIPPDVVAVVPSPLARRKLLSAGAGGLVALGAGLVAWKTGVLLPAQTTPRTVAVLPFRNLSGDKGQDYFSEGLAEEVRGALSRIAQLKVAAPTTSAQFRGLTRDAKWIGAKLGVGFLLEGSVRKSGEIVRIAASLIDAHTGFSTWSRTFDRKLVDVFAVQSEIANAVAEALAVQVGDAASIPGGTTSVAAFDAFLHGRELYNADAGEASDRAALAQFDAALRLDPRYGSAHAARSRSLVDVASSYGQADQLPTMFAEALAAARMSIAIAPDLAIGHWALGNALFYGKLDPRGARDGYDRAFELAAGDADVGIAFAQFCLRTGRTREAQLAVDKSLMLDPLNPRAFRVAGQVASFGPDRAKALAHFQHAIELNPKLAFVRSQLGTLLYKAGKLDEARAAFADEPNDLFRLTGLAIVDRRLGQIAAAEASVQEVIRTMGDNALYQLAQIRAQGGEIAAALAALERARVVGDSGLTSVLIDPMLDPLRRQPQFLMLLKRLGFT